MDVILEVEIQYVNISPIYKGIKMVQYAITVVRW